MLRDIQRKKLNKLNDNVSSNKINISKLPKVHYLNSDVIYAKKKNAIILLNNEYFDVFDWTGGIYILEQTIENVTSKHLSFIRPVFFVNSTDGTNFEDEDFLYFPSYTYLWKKSGENYIFKFRFNGIIFTPSFAQSYLNLSLKIINPRVWHEISNNKT